MNFTLPEPVPPNDRAAHNVEGPARVLVLPDIHAPYHARESLGMALQYGVENRATHVLINGDMVDFHAISHWETDPRKRLGLAEEISIARGILRCIRLALPRAQIIYKLGNHEDRLRRYVIQKAPELFGLPIVTVEGLLETDHKEIRAKVVPGLTPVRLGKLTVLHGHEYRFAISNPVNPARGLFLRAKTSALCSHFHQVSEHSERAVDSHLITTWSTGCLCDLSPDYRPLNNWSHGFAFVGVDKDGTYDVQNLRIYKGRIYA